MSGQEVNSTSAGTSNAPPVPRAFQPGDHREFIDGEPFQSSEFSGYEPFVDEEVIARFLQITPRRVLEMARDGEIPAHPIGRTRKTWRFRISEISQHYSTPHGSQGGAKLTSAVPGATRRKQ